MDRDKLKNILSLYKSKVEDVQQKNMMIEEKKKCVENLKRSVLEKYDEVLILNETPEIPDDEFLEKYLQVQDYQSDLERQEQEQLKIIEEIKKSKEMSFRECDNLARSLKVIKMKIVEETKKKKCDVGDGRGSSSPAPFPISSLE